MRVFCENLPTLPPEMYFSQLVRVQFTNVMYYGEMLKYALEENKIRFQTK